MMDRKVSCLGPEGSFSALAARTLCKDGTVVLCKSFAEAVSRLLSKETEYAVLPVENSLGGGVVSVLDLLAENDIFGEEEAVLSVDHRLAMLEGVKAGDIRRVYSHEQALLQCACYLQKNFPQAELVGTLSTAESLNKLDGCSAGIVGAHMKREGVVLSAENIADNKKNCTRFLRFRRGTLRDGEHGGAVFLCAQCAHEPGSLVKLLQIFSREGLNLTRIESRPVKEEPGKYRFFIELKGDIGSPSVQRAVCAARAYCSKFKLIGVYA